jgi:3-oxoacyl-[acyl-carrier protein] reductase
MELKDRVAIVTGAARGIGRTTALTFVREGARVVIVDRLEKELYETEEMIRGKGAECLPILADVSISSMVQDMVKQAMDTYNRIDILVNNAGILGPMKMSWEVTEDEWDEVLENNLKSVWLCSKYVAPIMIQQKRGNVVNLSSIAGKQGVETISAYAASKAAIQCLSRSMARELAPHGIRVNALSPAMIETPMVAFMTDELRKLLLSRIPVGRFGRTEDVAEMILYLVSERASFILGQCFNITGGRGDY